LNYLTYKFALQYMDNAMNASNWEGQLVAWSGKLPLPIKRPSNLKTIGPHWAQRRSRACLKKA
jgi:hypothetical protein